MWSYASPNFNQHSYVFIKGLRRQDAILQTKLASWLAHAMGEGTVIAYWDVTTHFLVSAIQHLTKSSPTICRRTYNLLFGIDINML
eukprot:6215679-Heterocapsa_arctica.AAC.1